VRNNNAKKWNMRIIMLSSEDKIWIKTYRNVKDFLPENSSRNTVTKIEKTNIGRLSAKVAHNRFERTL